MNITRALEVLNDGIKQGFSFASFIFNECCLMLFFSSSIFITGGKEELATLILALVGSIRATSTNSDEKSIHDLSLVTKLFQRPYVRAMFAFILTQDANDLQYECVLVMNDILLSKIDLFEFSRMNNWI